MGKVINHQRRKYNKLQKQIPRGSNYELDHIIPYCLTEDSSDENLQLLTKKEHRKKTTIDLKIIKLFRNKGWIEKITHYSHEILIPLEKIKEEYLKEFVKKNNAT